MGRFVSVTSFKRDGRRLRGERRVADGAALVITLDEDAYVNCV